MTRKLGAQVILVIAVLSSQLGVQGFVSRSTYFQQRSYSSRDVMVMPSASIRSEELEQPDNLSLSLAGPYLVRCSFEENQGTWSLIPLSGAAIPTTTDSDGKTYKSQGARAWAALHSPLEQPEPSMILQCQCNDLDSGNGNIGTIRVTCTGNDLDEDSSSGDLVSIMTRLLAQWTLSRQYQGRHPTVKEWMVDLPNDAKSTDSYHSPVITTNDWTSNDGIRKLFSSFLDTTAVAVELVEMVDRHGNALGILPRKLVHTHNLLHRGIGMFVTKDQYIMSSSSSDDQSVFPYLYVHRRTDTKRIFPSLYDMFVGGVATAGEDVRTTACREVAEELGLVEQSHLSPDPILSCVVCTAYNRCVVTLYCYRMDTSREKVSWQEEEVAWGEFVPYAIIQAAADRSIQRFHAKVEWPGSDPPIQSASEGAAPADLSYDSNDWAAWDFVPDGLLVWEAWLQWLDEQQK